MSNAIVDMNPFKISKAWYPEFDTRDVKPLSDSEVRVRYNEQVSEAYQSFLKEAAVFHEADQCFGEDLARKAFTTRDSLKKANQADTSILGQVYIYFRNLLSYGAGNATYEGLSQKKNPEEIAYSAFKTDGGDMGLAGNGFGDILNTWNAIKAVSTLYPEDITPEMVAAFKVQKLVGAIDPAAILAARTTAAVAATDIQDDDGLNGLDISTVPAPRAEPPVLMSADELFASQMPRRRLGTYI